jgi:hypothetical protein
MGCAFLTHRKVALQVVAPPQGLLLSVGTAITRTAPITQGLAQVTVACPSGCLAEPAAIGAG